MCLLVPLYIEFIAATPCINMAVEVEVQNGIRLTGDGSFKPDNYVVVSLLLFLFFKHSNHTTNLFSE